MFTALLCCCIALGVSFLMFRNKKGPKNGPPGPYIWPVLGNLVEMVWINANYPHLALMEMAKKYGDVFALGFGVHYAVLISSYEKMQEILTKNEVCLERYNFPFVTARGFQKENMGIIWNGGSSWHELRRYTIKRLREFGFEKKRSMEVIILEEMQDFVSEIRDQIQPNGQLAVDQGTLAASTINILWSLVAGYRFPMKDEKVYKTVQLNNNVLEALGFGNRYLAMPFLKDWFPGWSLYNKHADTYKELHDFMREIIVDVQAKRMQRPDTQPENYIEAFLDDINNSKGDPKSNFTEEQLLVVLSDLFLAGSETISTTLDWAILFLTLNPKVQQKIYEEIMDTCASSGVSSITLNQEPKMPYVKATIYETFRFADPVPITAARSVSEDISVGDFVIPKGSCVMWNLEPVFRDKAYWGDPEVFRPERFLDATGTKVVRTERVAAFGFGKRVCMGEKLAWDALFMYLVSLCSHFKFDPMPGKKLTIIPKSGSMTCVPQDYCVKVTARN